MSKTQIISVSNWEEFEGQLEKLRQQSTLSDQHPSRLFFRGQESSAWSLATTLERSAGHVMSLDEYYRLITRVKPSIEAFVGTQWDIPEYPAVKKSLHEYEPISFAQLPAYEYMVYLRHHGFPSPLLDWTRSQYVAAFFAFRHAVEAEQIASIYVYCERPMGVKTHSSSGPVISSLGPYIRTHKRHFLQQCEYTICLSCDSNSGWDFAAHEEVFAGDDYPPRSFAQDVLWKIKIPSTERLKVLKLLDAHNLNAYSLFGSEESLMETMALREIYFRLAPSRLRLPT